jgi:hypothetical protein
MTPKHFDKLNAAPQCPLEVFLCHAHNIPLWDADTLASTGRNPVRGLPEGTRLTADGVDAWLDKEKPCGERSRTILPGQGWELEIRKAVRESV